MPVSCPSCTGIGLVVEDPCNRCGGNGCVDASVAAMAQLPAGVDNGTIVRMKGLGDVGARSSGTAGDAFIKVTVQPHPLFWRKGDDVHLDVPITMPQACLGGTVTVPTLKGDQTIEFPRGLQSGDLFSMPGFGIKNVKDNSKVGAQVNRFVVKIPTDLTDEQEELMRRFNQEPALNAQGESYSFGAPASFKGSTRR